MLAIYVLFKSRRTRAAVCAFLMLATAAQVRAQDDLLSQMLLFSQYNLAADPGDSLGRDLLAVSLALAPDDPSANTVRRALLAGAPIASPLVKKPTQSALAGELAELGKSRIRHDATRNAGLLCLAAAKRLDPLQESAHILLITAKERNMETDFDKLLLEVAGKHPLAPPDQAPREQRPQEPERPPLNPKLSRIPERRFSYYPNSPASRLNAIGQFAREANFQLQISPDAGIPVRDRNGDPNSHDRFADTVDVGEKRHDSRPYLFGSLNDALLGFCLQANANFRIENNRTVVITPADDPIAIKTNGFVMRPQDLKAVFADNQSKATMRYRGQAVYTGGAVTGVKRLAGNKSAIILDGAIEIHLDRQHAELAQSIQKATSALQDRQNPKNYDFDDHQQKEAYKKARSRVIRASLQGTCWGSKFGTVIIIDPNPFSWGEAAK